MTTSPEVFERIYWLKHEEYWTSEDGVVIFKEGTPQRVIDSYNAWMRT